MSNQEIHPRSSQFLKREFDTLHKIQVQLALSIFRYFIVTNHGVKWGRGSSRDHYVRREACCLGDKYDALMLQEVTGPTLG